MEILYTANSPGLDRFSEQRAVDRCLGRCTGVADPCIRDNTDADSGECKHGDNAEIRCNPGLSNSVLRVEVRNIFAISPVSFKDLLYKPPTTLSSSLFLGIQKIYLIELIGAVIRSGLWSSIIQVQSKSRPGGEGRSSVLASQHVTPASPA